MFSFLMSRGLERYDERLEIDPAVAITALRYGLLAAVWPASLGLILLYALQYAGMSGFEILLPAYAALVALPYLGLLTLNVSLPPGALNGWRYRLYFRLDLWSWRHRLTTGCLGLVLVGHWTYWWLQGPVIELVGTHNISTPSLCLVGVAAVVDFINTR